ncbi:MAG: AzlD domain-containing protein [Candidatus Paraimprobicoccus trichonymphae]|uniref:AzlD domain-containing protein n=1 Tax=Candidatus Paraimprobicoccus trichonymphae TaxID=3033793 RepID=A0AA48HW69_9FIRM|nr:MAG: AzlD domain-containing protein [Candidatus Paraimprobicoccus trichonymphae]
MRSEALLLLKATILMSMMAYVIKMLPLLICSKKLQIKLIKSFSTYITYVIFICITNFKVFFSTLSVEFAALGIIISYVLAYFKQSLLTIFSNFSLLIK